MTFSVRNFFNTLATRSLNLVLPPRCPMTGALVGTNGTVSPQFWAQLNFIHDSYCHNCGAPFRHAIEGATTCANCLQNPPPFTRARSVMRYDDASTKMILKFKHADGTVLAPLFANWLMQFGEDILAQSDMIIPVPLHRWRLLKRRYNQAALLGTLIAKKSGLLHAPHILRRSRHTPSQGQKTPAQRTENIRNAFMVSDVYLPTIKDKRIVLIDDVYTSGATARECARALLDAGAAEVNVLTLARAGFAN